MNTLLAELRRRNVFRVAAAYLVVGWILIQVITLIETPLGLPDWTDTLVIVLLALGLPIALLLAWAFEMTPDGMQKTSPIENNGGFRPLGSTDFVLIGLMVLVLAVVGFQMVKAGSLETAPAMRPDSAIAIAESDQPSAPAPAISDLSIAVLPFADLSAAGDQAYFGDGMAEEILNLLARIENMDVTSRTSAFQYRGDGFSIPEIAAALNVRHILEGSIRKDGDTVRITAQLIDAIGDRHLWSQTFDRPLTTGALFAVQDEISVAIVAALSEALDIEMATPEAATVITENLDAYEAYLEARNLFRARAEFGRIEELLDRALSQDPDFANAWALRGAARGLATGYDHIEISPGDNNRLALDYANRALVLDPQNAMALAVRGFVRQSDNEALVEPLHDWAEIVADFDAALVVDPNSPEALNWRGNTMIALGFPAEARANFLQCFEANPFYVVCHANYCDQLVGAQDVEGALNCHREALARGLIISPGVYLSLFADIGDERSFMMTLSDPRVFPGWNRNAEIYQAFRDPGGDHSALRVLLEAHLETLPDDRYRARLNQELFVPLGGETEDTFVAWGPIFSRYRRSTGFRRYMEQSGVLTYWQTHGFPPQCRAVSRQDGGDDDFECD